MSHVRSRVAPRRAMPTIIGKHASVGAGAVAAMIVLAASGAGAQDHPPAVIGVIEVVTNEVFDERGEGLTAPYRAANKVHVRTRDRVVLRELLFETGDPVNQELVEQTERNLRELLFLRDARVETVPVDEDLDGHVDRVDIRVTTWDRWSLSPRFDVRQVQNQTIWEIGASEKNLLGLGKAVTVSHRTNLDRTTDQVVYEDHQVAGSNVGLVAALANLSDGHEQFFVLDRGFLSLQDPWAVSVGAGSFRRTDPLFEDGAEISRLRHRAQWGDLEVGRAVRRRGNHAVRLHGAYRLRKERVGSDGRNFGIVEIGLRSISHRFVRLTHVNQFERTEDINLGTESYGTLGVSTPALGGNEGQVVFLAAGHTRGVSFRDDHFVLAGIGVGGRHEHGQWRNALASVGVRYLRKHAERHALIGKVEYRHGHNLDPEVQLLLGAETGLRGYPVRQFAGDRSLLLSAEERWFFADDVGQLVSLGAAAFVDSGFVWPEAAAVNLGDLKTGVGVSLLIGANRLSSRGGVRLDVGYGLNPVAGSARWVIAAGTDIEF